MRSSYLGIVLLPLFVCIAYAPATAWWRKDKDDSRERESSAPHRRAVEPTYLDTLNHGRELSLAESDFSEIAHPDKKTARAAPAGRKKHPNGYRIQCLASGTIETIRAHKKKADGELDLASYIVYAEPYYKLHVGDFTTREAAQSALPAVRKAGYREAWIVRSSVLVDE
ncbi:MAG: hypothetical protein GF418_02540 [Chitinivibrionales bacterium]|nr:hypothetical protein [Chitinivibrionales bacterium]MBD3394480.1 hypothetical protein [Chitinivibrionales bacterium]